MPPLPLHLSVDLRDPRPAYRQIADQVAWLVSTGALSPGDPLPSVRQVASDLGMNLNTVARAYRELAGSGILEVRRGKRARVARGPAPARGGGPREEERVRGGIRRLRAEALRLGIGIARLRRLLREEMKR